MATLTVRLPDDKHMRLKALAKHKHISINKLMEELSTQAIAEFDAETRFRAIVAKGSIEKGLAVLDKLDNSLRPRRECRTR
ncbi:toxin-antitoxin system HicB family antitoxin [Candidatus Thiosymbion oneisti]|uniref:toxin-antitoxin system HicB family antitoxin n=1 Tax=Candidatus Thiosymbion oneisti TaxID=589554 RepID=UPI000B284349|nr:toxin-antitoxin system HicB family antitoxin [Candidatus Thiosymbion oneisti]